MRSTIFLTCVLLLGFAVGCGGGGIEGDLADNQIHLAVLNGGDGVVAGAGDHVSVRIGTWILDQGVKGRQLDHFGREPLTLHLVRGEMMPGLLEAITGMREGGTRRAVIAPEKITPRFRPPRLLREEALWCEIELLDVARVETVDLAVGDGQTVVEGDYLEIDYTGWHADSTGAKADRFTGSEQDGSPARLMVGSGMVNRGLDIGLVGMKVGGTRRIIVPAALAYGDQGQGDVRGGETLIYEVTARLVLGVETETVRVGSGGEVRPGRRVRFHLAGWIRDPDGTKGEKFQDSRDMQNPYTTVMGQFKLQPGIELALRGMKVGELRRVDVPSELAFGSRGWHRGPRTLVPPDTDVVYEIEVLSAGSS